MSPRLKFVYSNVKTIEKKFRNFVRGGSRIQQLGMTGWFCFVYEQKNLEKSIY